MGMLRIFLAVVSILATVNAYKILVVSPMPGKSHAILGDGIVKHLANAGHEISYITAFVPKKIQQNVKILDVSANNEIFKPLLDKFMDFKSILNNDQSMNNMFKLITGMANLTVATLENPQVTAVLNDANLKFDLVLAEWMYSEIYAGLAAIFDCPLIWFSPTEPHWKILRIIDEIPNPAYTSDLAVNNYPPFTFFQRIKELGMQILGLMLNGFYIKGIEDANYNKLIVPFIEQRGRVAPRYDDLKFSASLVLGNSHVSLGVPFRVPDSYKAIGGYHIEKNVKPLPQDLKNLLDNAKDGVIYFSMGSNLKSKSLPTEVKTSLLKMFGELKQTVLWKFEEDLPNRPKNVHILQWAPQPSILAHKNCILFITHGGLLSTTETVHFGVPIIGMPVFADQFLNIGRAVKKGFAKEVNLSYKMADDLKFAISEVLSDSSYRQKAKELSFIYHDRPAAPGAELVHWVEHVIRTRGAPHLRSPALLVPWYQKIYLDLVALLVTFILVIKHLIKLVLRSRRNLNINKKNK